MLSFGLLILLIILSFLLIRSADLVIASLHKLSSKTKAGTFALSAILLALGTSLPELTVGLTSALDGLPNLVLGVVVGSNIANLALVAGLATVIRGRVNVNKNYYRRDILITFLASIAPILLIIDGELSRVDGIVLISVYGSYAMGFFKRRYQEVARGATDPKESVFYRFFKRLNLVSGSRDYGKLLIGLAMLLLFSDLIVRLSQVFAMTIDIPVFLVGLFVISIGTSLPELAFSFRSLEENHPSMFFGNLLGSTIANSTLIIGVTAAISPIQLFAVTEYITAVIAFFVIFFVFWLLIKSKHYLTRWEGAILLVLYVIFLLVELVQEVNLIG